MSAETWRLAEGVSPVRLCAKIGDEAHTIAKVYLTDPVTKKRTPEALARAKMIEAAPKMREVCELAASVSCHNLRGPFGKRVSCGACQSCKAREALAACGPDYTPAPDPRDEEIKRLRLAGERLATYVDGYEYGRPWAGRPHAQMDAMRAALRGEA